MRRHILHQEILDGLLAHAEEGRLEGLHGLAGAVGDLVEVFGRENARGGAGVVAGPELEATLVGFFDELVEDLNRTVSCCRGRACAGGRVAEDLLWRGCWRCKRRGTSDMNF